MSRPISVTIDLQALQHNYRLAKRLAGEAKALAVVKANAYGHGLSRCVAALAEEADGFALLDIADAGLLRSLGVTQPLVLLEGFFSREDLGEVAAQAITPAIHCDAQLAMLAAADLSRPIDVMLKVNTGMNRLGFRPAEVPAALARLRALPCVGNITLMTHFAHADEEEGIAEQFAIFAELAKQTGLPTSVANSAALFRFPEVHGNVVRPGILLYGASPMPAMASAESLGLQPVMTLETEIIGVQQLAAGERVGYGGLFKAEAPTRVGVVACGYADGYPRHAATGTPILVDGRRTRTLGRVSMDMLACDLTDLPDAGIGSKVTLWGRGLPADEVAQAAGTISYELFCALAARVPVSVLEG